MPRVAAAVVVCLLLAGCAATPETVAAGRRVPTPTAHPAGWTPALRRQVGYPAPLWAAGFLLLTAGAGLLGYAAAGLCRRRVA